MSSDVFRRIGRGGAGNFYSKQDIQAVEKASETDLEAQDQPLADLNLTRTRTAGTNSGTDPKPNYARSGRGGAGNFTFPSASASTSTSASASAPAAADAQTEFEAANRDEALAEADRAETAAAVAASLATKSKTGGLSGRGGAGNWRTGDGRSTEEKEEERKAIEELEKRVLNEVSGELPPPARAYTPRRL
ncbi:hypothetical protein C7999DRAFT_43064 [Corynascus novoguineensis]|uniref:Uncharacterized protein n=1 Tax=Corynascus novoguineensis TaxID=1126955 RepID=A0AAN7CQ76_9PEZI|nr:hypothetical protein C7999DRAFT_43064 [Corynascus novoguineensis]